MTMQSLFPQGEKIILGTRHFDAASIIAFARKFDPQPFHVDAELAKDSLFGGLCASGWHTTAGWMRSFLDHWQTIARRLAAEGKPLPVMGPSPGFSDLSWSRPVFAGDTVTYSLTAQGSRALRSKPGWHINTSLAEGANQRGEPVLRFTSNVLEYIEAGEEP